MKILVVEISKDWAFLSCKNYIGYVILVKLRFCFTIFRDINESNGLKLQLFFKQLALGIEIIKQLSRLNHLGVSINIKYLAI